HVLPPFPTHALPICFPSLAACAACAAQNASAGVACRSSKLLFDPQQLVVLRETIRTGKGARLDLPTIRCDRQVGNGGILGLTGRSEEHTSELQSREK